MPFPSVLIKIHSAAHFRLLNSITNNIQHVTAMFLNTLISKLFTNMDSESTAKSVCALDDL